MRLSSTVDAANMQGGKSTICLGMETAAAAPPSSNAFACGAHQNSRKRPDRAAHNNAFSSTRWQGHSLFGNVHRH